jgi:transposase
VRDLARAREAAAQDLRKKRQQLLSLLLRHSRIIVVVTFVAEIGDVRRFDNPRQLMAFLGLVPAERSPGERVRRAGLTLAGNRRARRVLIEGAWTYRYPARVSDTLRPRLEGVPKTIRDIAWR